MVSPALKLDARAVLEYCGQMSHLLCWPIKQKKPCVTHAQRKVLTKMHEMRGTVKHDKKINVWGCFSSGGGGWLHRIISIMDQEIMDILEEPMLHSADLLFGK